MQPPLLSIPTYLRPYRSAGDMAHVRQRPVQRDVSDNARSLVALVRSLGGNCTSTQAVDVFQGSKSRGGEREGAGERA